MFPYIRVLQEPKTHSVYHFNFNTSSNQRLMVLAMTWYCDFSTT